MSLNGVDVAPHVDMMCMHWFISTNARAYACAFSQCMCVFVGGRWAGVGTLWGQYRRWRRRFHCCATATVFAAVHDVGRALPTLALALGRAGQCSRCWRGRSSRRQPRRTALFGQYGTLVHGRPRRSSSRVYVDTCERIFLSLSLCLSLSLSVRVCVCVRGSGAH
jgi:hypothetical protein